jgi:glycosyltransferase involved in cell wall biosynthesis
LRGRLRNKTAQIAHRLANLESRWELGYLYPELRETALGRRSDLFIAHSEPGLAVGVDLLRAGRTVGVDMEDWFSEDLLPEARKGRPITLLRKLERQILQRSTYAACPSRAMSRRLSCEYDSPHPTTIYNAFSWSERFCIDGLTKDRKTNVVPSVHWFSQTIGPGRGLEDLFAALPHLRHPAEIHLRGNLATDFELHLSRLVPADWRDRVFIQPLVANQELLSRITEHDIGFAGETTCCRSRDLTVTNKILQYLLAGLAVVASDTSGQKEVAEKAPGAVLMYTSGDAVALAERLNELLGSPSRLESAKREALKAAESTFCWERQEEVLLDAVERAMALQQQRRSTMHPIAS